MARSQNLEEEAVGRGETLAPRRDRTLVEKLRPGLKSTLEESMSIAQVARGEVEEEESGHRDREVTRRGDEGGRWGRVVTGGRGGRRDRVVTGGEPPQLSFSHILKHCSPFFF